MLEDTQGPITDIKELEEGWAEEICEHLSFLRTKYLSLAEEYSQDDDAIDDDFMDHVLRYANFHNCSRAICDDGPELPVLQTSELVPSLAWIRHILYPERFPHPDTLDDTPSP